LTLAEEIFLGAASFIYTLKNLNADFNIIGQQHNLYVSLYLSEGREKTFFIFAEERTADDCGYIQTDTKTIMDLFNENNHIVLATCKRETDQSGKNVAHCPISKDSDKLGNIETVVKGRIFNCRM